MLLKHSRFEIEVAEQAIMRMKQSKSIEEYESEWRTFLFALEKIWIKTERSCQGFRSKFELWQSQYKKERKKDMLLKYLKQARDADNHSIQEMKPENQSMRFLRKGTNYIKSMVMRGGKLLHYEGDPIKISIKKPHPVAVRIKNSGKWYNPPTSHNGKRIETPHPTLLAELGLSWYKSFVVETEKEFS